MNLISRYFIFKRQFGSTIPSYTIGIILFMLQRLEHPECCPKEYYNLMLKCWQHDPDQRPRFKDLMKMLPEVKLK